MDLHSHPPMTLGQVSARFRWLVPAAILLFVALAAGAVFNTLPWDEAITRWLVSLRTPELNAVIRRVSFLGSNKVVFPVAGLAALLAARRCPRLALAIVIVAVARPVAEFTLKELISRPRPDGHRMVNGAGYSFPSGHPLAIAASWGLLPPVIALYTRRRFLWWASAISVWILAVAVAFSRVWLGVHWASDVVAALALTILGVAGAEWLLLRLHGGRAAADPDPSAHLEADDVDAQVLDVPVLEATA